MAPNSDSSPTPTYGAFPDCRASRDRFALLERALERENQREACVSRAAAGLRVRLLRVLVFRAPSPVRTPTCGDCRVEWCDGES